MMRTLIAILIALSMAAPARAEQNFEVDLLLVLAVDVSRSVDPHEFALQRKGHVEALRHPNVHMAIRMGKHKRIAVAYVEWSGLGEQRLLIDWTVIDSEKSANEFASKLEGLTRPFWGRTSLSQAIDFSVDVVKEAPYKAPRIVIDIAGDGTENEGGDVLKSRKAALDRNITINGLVILPQSRDFPQPHTHPEGGLEKYYRDHVIGGDASFLVVAENFEAYAYAILRKLILEISGISATQHAMLQ